MRKLLVVAFLACFLAVPIAYAVDVPAVYRGATPQEIRLATIDSQEMRAEANARKLGYALTGLVALFGGIAVFSFISARRRRMATAADSAFVGTLAAAVSAKRNLGSKIEARIKAQSLTDE